MQYPKGVVQLTDERSFELEFGAVLPQLDVAYETWGTLAEARDNVILICPAFSAHSHAQSHFANPTPGWWEGMIGAGKAFDTERFFMLCPSLLGGYSGTTGPASLDPRTGNPYGSSFPVVSVRDIVNVHVRLLDDLGIERLYAVAGGSLGAMEAIELAVRHPHRAARVIAASGTDCTRPYTAAVRHLGRRAIQLALDGGGPEDDRLFAGLKLAREIGTLFYRSRREFNQRFSWEPMNPPSRRDVTFEVQSYLDYQANKILGRFDPDSYQTLSLAMDLHNVWRGFASREEALAAVTASFTVIGVAEDSLIPIDEQEELHRVLRDAGVASVWRPVSSRIGHDFFLAEIDEMTRLVAEALDPGPGDAGGAAQGRNESIVEPRPSACARSQTS